MSETPFDDASLIDLEPVLGGCDSAKERRLRNLAKKLGFALVKPWAGERRGIGGLRACYVLVPQNSGLTLDEVETILSRRDAHH